VPFLEKDEALATDTVKHPDSLYTAGSTWFRTFAELAKDEALHRMHVLSELGVMPTTLSKVRSVLSQRYSGDITILPEVSYTEFPNVLKNPTTDFMLRAMLSGEQATWPKLTQVRNHCAIELALDDAVQRVRTRLVFSPSQVDLRMSAFAKSDALGGLGKRRKNRRASHESPGENLHLAVPQQLRPSTLSMYYRYHNKINVSDLESTSSGIETGPSSTAEDFEYSEDIQSNSSLDSPPSPRIGVSTWPTRQLFPSVSQPTTPSIASRVFTFSPFTPSAPQDAPPTALGNPTRAPSSPERRYKQIFHRSKTGDIPTIAVLDGDSPNVGDAKDKTRRERSLSTGQKGLFPPKRH